MTRTPIHSSHCLPPPWLRWLAAAFFTLDLFAASGAEPDFVSLFDGKTLKGWSAPDMSYWSVKDGAITASCAGPVADYSYLVWQDGQPADFELKLKFRITGDAGANSGIQIRSQVRPDGFVIGYQADIARYEKHCAIFYDETPNRGMLADRGERVVIDEQGKRTVERFADAGELWRRIKIDDWNDYHIIARGQTVSARVNGHRMWEVTDRETARNGAAPGVIALQIHKGPPMTVLFKDIFLKDFSGKPAVSAKPTHSALKRAELH